MTCRILNWLILLSLAGLSLSACQDTAPASQEQDGKLKVVATTSIVADVVNRIAGGQVELVTLLPAGADPHIFEPRPKDVAAMADAELVFASGAGLEEFLKPLLASAGAADRLVEVSSGITLLPFEDQEEHTGEDQGHGYGDPHTWLDPNNVMVWAENITAALSRADPEHAQMYSANAQAYIAELHDLDEWIRQQVEQLPAERRKLVTDHRTMSYFAKMYGFELLGEVVGSFSTAAQPSAQELAALQDQITAFEVPAIFLDETANPILAEQLAQDTGVNLVRIYTGSLGSADSPAADYIAMMHYNVEAIVTALQK